MKLSYIIPTYNLPPEDIRRCLTSLSEQDLSREEYEVIVVDDESDVSPEPVVREFEPQMNVSFLRQPHARQGAARNAGIRQAMGDYIRFVDGDDYLPPHTAAHFLDVMERNALDILIFGFKRPTPNPSRKGGEPSPSRGSGERVFLSGKAYMEAHTVFGSPCTMSFRRSLMENPPLRFAENTFIEDEEFVTRLVWRSGSLAVTPDVGYIYVQRPDSTVHRPTPEHTDELFSARFAALDGIVSLAQTEPQPHEGLDRKIRFLSLDILRHALRQGDWRQRYHDCCAGLFSRGLFPLPRARYGWKYAVFRQLSLSRPSQRLLHFLENNIVNRKP